MKIKSNHTKQINYTFGLALLILALLFGVALGQLREESNLKKAEALHQDSIPVIHNFTPQLLELQINNENFKKIKQKREAALKKGLLFTSRSDLVPADIRIGDESYAVDLRLKGDLLDHLRGEKWSYRIELKKNARWNRMSEFSVHNSKARSHIAEWLMLQMLSNEGIITPLYDFIKIEENGIAKGVYAYEEHFTDELLLRNKRQIAPILKHNDDAYWENVQKELEPFYWTKALEIDLFNKNNSGDPNFMESFEYAKSMLQQFLDKEISAGDIFDLDKMAKYYALMELSHAFHAQQITNIRFYVNPVTGKLEPIAFDCFGDELPAVSENWEAAGQGINPKVSPRKGYPYGGVYMHLLFQDNIFFKKYMNYLEQFTSPEYLTTIQKRFQHAVNVREAFIKTDKEYIDYNFEFDRVFKKASFTRKKINPLPNYSLKVFTRNNTRRELSIKSFHYFPMEIIGFGNEIKLIDSISSGLILEAFNKDVDQESYTLINPNERKYIYYKTIGSDSIFSHQINLLNEPKDDTEALRDNLSFWLDNKFLKRFKDTLLLTNKKTILTKHMIIPDGYHLKFEPGQIVEFKTGASIISQSNFIANGTKENQIEFIGDGTANQGILINNTSNNASEFSNCRFSNLTEVLYKGVNSTAGLSINGTVSMSHCSFQTMLSTHAVSITTGPIMIDNIKMENCVANGLHLVNLNGLCNHSTFSKIGRNALSIHSANVTAFHNDFDQVDNTAIELYDSNESEINSTTIKNSFVGIHIKESEKITATAVDLENIQNGIQLEGSDSHGTSFETNSFQTVNVGNILTKDNYSSVFINGEKVIE